MGRRQYKRHRFALPVTISGLDSNGNRFAQSATTVEIGVNGMRLRGVRCLRAPGEPVQVEYQGRRARYRVAWIGAKGTCWEGLVGLQGTGVGVQFVNLPECARAAIEKELGIIKNNEEVGSEKLEVRAEIG